jgi:hypothetical protein
VAVFLDEAVPAVGCEFGNRKGGDGDRADALFGMVSGVGGEAVDFDRHAVTSGGADFQNAGIAAVEVEREFWFAELRDPHVASAEKAGFFLDEP